MLRVTYLTVVPLLKDTLVERTPLSKGHTFLAASAVNICSAPSHYLY